MALYFDRLSNLRHCGKQCLLPGEKPKDLTRSERAIATLTVHHANFTPEDNRPENLIPLCAPCHLAVHQHFGKLSDHRV